MILKVDVRGGQNRTLLLGFQFWQIYHISTSDNSKVSSDIEPPPINVNTAHRICERSE